MLELITEKQAMQVLSDVVIPNRTHWSIVYNMATKKIQGCVNGNYVQSYEYNMNDF